MKASEFLKVTEICPWQIFSIEVLYRDMRIFHSHVDESFLSVLSVFWVTGQVFGENKGLSDGKRGAKTLLI